MKKNFVTSWVGDMAFEADIAGHKVLMDAEEKFGGQDKGPRPKPLIIAALTGCTGMDVVSILKKMRIDVDGFRMLTETESTDEHPKTYTKIHLIYEFAGADLDISKLEKAVKLSQEQYCGVAALLQKGLELTYEIKVK